MLPLISETCLDLPFEYDGLGACAPNRLPLIILNILSLNRDYCPPFATDACLKQIAPTAIAPCTK